MRAYGITVLLGAAKDVLKGSIKVEVRGLLRGPSLLCDASLFRVLSDALAGFGVYGLQVVQTKQEV